MTSWSSQDLGETPPQRRIPISKGSDLAWERFGSTDPYFGVLTGEEYRGTELMADIRARFFSSGEARVTEVLRTIRQYFEASFQPRRILDFGCGVGRVVIPFAQTGAEVTGVDISPSMLVEAAANVRRFGLSGVDFVQSDDALSTVTGTYDLVHSHIVFQHIPRRRGERIFARLVELVTPGGYGALHVQFVRHTGRARRLLNLSRRIPMVNAIANVARGLPWNEPLMQMNAYDLGRLLVVIECAGAKECHVVFGGGAGWCGGTLYFKKGS